MYHGPWDISRPFKTPELPKAENDAEASLLEQFQGKRLGVPAFKNEIGGVTYIPSKFAERLHLNQLKYRQHPSPDFYKHMKNNVLPLYNKRDTSETGIEHDTSKQYRSQNKEKQNTLPINEQYKRIGKTNNLYNLLKGMKKFSWIDDEGLESACLDSSCELSKRSIPNLDHYISPPRQSYSSIPNGERLRDLQQFLINAMDKQQFLGKEAEHEDNSQELPSSRVKRNGDDKLYRLFKTMKKSSYKPNEKDGMYRLFKTMKRNPNPFDRGNEALYRVLKTMKRAPDRPFEEINEDSNCAGQECSTSRRGQEKLYQMFKTMKRYYDNDDLYRSLKTMKKSNDLYRAFKTMKKFHSYPLQEFLHAMYKEVARIQPPLNGVEPLREISDSFSKPRKRSNDLYRAFKTMKRSDNLYRTLKTLKRSNDLYRAFKTMKKSYYPYKDLFRPLKTTKKSHQLYRAFKTMKKSSSELLEEPAYGKSLFPQSNFKRTKTKLYRILRTMKRNGPNSEALNRIDKSGSKGGRTKRSSQYMKYFSRYNKAKTGQRLKSTRQHLTLRLSKRSESPVVEGDDKELDDNKKPLILRMSKKEAIEDTMKHLILRMSKKDAVDDTIKQLLTRMSKKEALDDTMQHLILRMSKKAAIDKTMKHLLLRMSKKDAIDDTMKHLILRMSKKAAVDNAMKNLLTRMSKKDAIDDTMKHLTLRMSKKDVFDDTMKHMIPRMSKKEDVTDTMKHLILRMSKKDSNAEDTMKHLILRLSKKDDISQDDNELMDSMKHLVLRLSKKDGFLSDDSKTNDKIQNMILRPGQYVNGQSNDKMMTLNDFQQMISRMRKRVSSSPNLDNTRQHLTLRLSKKDGQLKDTRKHLILRLSKKDKEVPDEVQDNGTDKRALVQEENPEFVEFMLRHLYNQVYPPIRTQPTESGTDKRLDYEIKTPEFEPYSFQENNVNEKALPASAQTPYQLEVGDRLMDKRVAPTDEIYRLLRTMRRNPETIDSNLMVDGKDIPSKKLKHVLVRMV